MDLQTRPYVGIEKIFIDGVWYKYYNDDYPIKAYDGLNVQKFVAQPLYTEHENNKHNVVVIPLMMSDEWNIINDNENLIASLRKVKKEYNFNFVGQCGYMGREIFSKLSLDNYDFQNITSANAVYSAKGNDKNKSLIEFLYRIAKSEFVFAPRGIGSSSFRAYQSMMVGSIPIITDMNDYPFKNEIDWDTICIRGKLADINELISKANAMTAEHKATMRINAMKFWDGYCKHDNLFKKLKDLICKK